MGPPREASRSLASFLCSEAECTKCVVQMPFDVLRGVERGTAWYRQVRFLVLSFGECDGVGGGVVGVVGDGLNRC